jgi:hypothetical protein
MRYWYVISVFEANTWRNYVSSTSSWVEAPDLGPSGQRIAGPFKSVQEARAWASANGYTLKV